MRPRHQGTPVAVAFRPVRQHAGAEPRRRAAQQAVVARERQHRQRLRLIHGHQGDAAWPDGELAGDELVGTAPGLGHRDGPVQRVAQLHEVEQDDVVHDGADRELRHELVHAEQLGVLVAQEGRHQALFAVVHQGVEEFAVELLVLQGGLVTRHPVDDQPFDVVRFNGPGDARKVHVQLQLARAVVEELDHPALQVLAQVEAEGLGVAHDLLGVLIEGDHQAALAGSGPLPAAAACPGRSCRRPRRPPPW